MFTEKDQALFEHMDYIQKRLLKKKKSANLNLVVLFIFFAGLGYVGTEEIALAIVIGCLPTMFRAVADDIIREIMLTQHNRALCDFEGDLEKLQLKLKLSSKLP